MAKTVINREEQAALYQYSCLLLEEKAALALAITTALMAQVLRDALSEQDPLSKRHTALAGKVAEYVNTVFEAIAGS